MKDFKFYILLLLVPIFWGGGFSATKHAATEIPPITLCTARYGIAAIFMLLWTVRQKLWDFDLIRKNFLSLSAVSLVGILGFTIFFTLGNMYTSAVTASLIIATYPSLTALFATILFKEAFTKQTAIGIILSYIGVVLAISQSSAAHLLKMSFGIGEFFSVLAVFCWAGYALLVKNVVSKKNLNPTLVATSTTVIGAIAFLIIAVIVENSWFRNFNANSISTQTGLEVIYISVFATFIAYILFNFGIKTIGATRASAYSNLTPVNALWIAALIYGEPISLNQIIGMIVTIAGVILTTTSKLKS